MNDDLLGKESNFVFGYLPVVIELFSELKEDCPVHTLPTYYARHLDNWLREHVIPGKYDCSKLRLSKDDAEIIRFSLNRIFGNFAFLKKGVSLGKAKRTAEALERASKICWDIPSLKYQTKVIEDPNNHIMLKKYLMESLEYSRSNYRSNEDMGMLAEYFVILCKEDTKLLKELALRYHCASKEASEYSKYLPDGD